MKTRQFTKKTIAYAAMAAMLHASLESSVAFARDTDIYLANINVGTAVEPNILIILDTSDSMNIPEPWKEYPGAYNSHVEYLWNDTTFIYHIGCSIASCDLGGDQYTNASKNLIKPADYAAGFLPQGYFDGATVALRGALKQAAINYATAEDALDPITVGTDARSIWRNYGAGSVTYLKNGTLTKATAPNGIDTDASWIYWLPAGTADTDGRLRAPSHNRFRGWQTNAGGVSGGINYGTASTDFSANNQCSASLSPLTPSTVYNPTSYAKNSGVYLNQKWQRWQPYNNLKALNGTSQAGSYPTTVGAATTSNGPTATATSGANVTYNNEFLGSTITPPIGAVPPGAHPAATDPVRDSADIVSNAAPVYFTASTPGSQGQPIRVQQAASVSEWQSLKPDLGGYIYQSIINSFNTTTLKDLMNGPYAASPATTTTTVKSYSWRGTGTATGTSSYYDYAARNLQLSILSLITLTKDCAWHSASPDNANVASPNNGSISTDSADATGVALQWRNKNTNFCVVHTNGPNSTADVDGNGQQDRLQVATACAAGSSGVKFKTVDYTGACAWSGRASIIFEGDPLTYYNGGTCGGNPTAGCTAAGGGSCTAPYCQKSGVTTGLVHGVNLVDYRTDNATNGCTLRTDLTVTCDSRNSNNCKTTNYAPTCNDVTAVVPGGAPTIKNYGTFNQAAKTDNLVHDCQADRGSTYLRRNAPLSNFVTAWSTGTTGGQPYATGSGSEIDWGLVNAVDMYSVNYLNWKFGPKGPDGHPIGRQTRLQIAKDALVDLVGVTDGVRFGLEVFNKLPSSDLTNLGSEGGNIQYAIAEMGVDAADPVYVNRAVLQSKLLSLTAESSTPLTESLYEAYLYYSGGVPLNGELTTPAVGGGTVSAGYDTTAISGSNYVSPMLINPEPIGTGNGPTPCPKNYIILISDGGPDRDINADTQIKALSQAINGGTVSPRTTVDTFIGNTPSDQYETGGVPYGPASVNNSGAYVWLDELAYYMASVDLATVAELPSKQSVFTYTVGFAGGSSAVLQQTASVSDGTYYTASDAAALTDVLEQALSSIKAWNPTVSAPTVPINANNRAENSDDVYMAFFQPSLTSEWVGTVKKWKLGDDEFIDNDGVNECGDDINGNPILICFTGQTVLNPPDGKNIQFDELDAVSGEIVSKVDPNASSFWNSLTDNSNPVQGGVGSRMLATLTPATRNFYTYVSATSTSQDLTNSANNVAGANTLITKTLLGDAAMTTPNRTLLIDYARGADPANTAQFRTWPHADVQHSSPAFVIYNSTTTPAVQYLLYLSSDGQLHAVDADTGDEKWAFMIEEAFPVIQDLKDDVAGEQIVVADSTPVAYIVDENGDSVINSSDTAILVFGQRRGGRAYYALDIRSKDAPQFLWKIDNTKICNPICSASTDYAELGQTWAVPLVAKIKATTDPVIVFGGGYDPNQDDPAANCANDTMGRAVYVTNLTDGSLIKGFDSSTGINCSMPSSVAVLNTDLDAANFADRIYEGDNGGSIWRFDINDPDPNNWVATWFADVGESGTPKHKILFPPAVVKQDFLGEVFDAVYVGTGNREDPLNATSEDFVIMLKDRETGLVSTQNDDCDSNADADCPITFDPADTSFVDITPFTDPAQAQAALAATPGWDGWFLDLPTGEKVTIEPTVFSNILGIATYTPMATISACTPPGRGNVYLINALSGAAIDIDQNGTIDSNDTRTVPNFYVRGYVSPGSVIIRGNTIFNIYSAEGLLSAHKIGTAGGGKRVYWYQEPEN